MIHKVIAAYKNGIVLQDELFVSLARRISEDNWDTAYVTLDIKTQRAFRQWCIAMFSCDNVRVYAAEVGDLLSRDQLDVLKNACEKRGWVEE